MIDGIKLQCDNALSVEQLNANKRFRNTEFDVNNETGEVYRNRWGCRGLRFSITPSTKPFSKPHININGSLAKYYNYGNNNAYDYTYSMLKATINKLEQDFGLDITKAEIKRLEFGVNIQPKQDVTAIIEGVKRYKNKEFSYLNDRNFKEKHIELSKAKLKIYDKGLQTRQPDTNLLRIEYVLRYRQTLQNFGIETLSDLLNLEKLNALKPLLNSVWDNLLFYDNRIDFDKISDKDRIKLSEYLMATNWKRYSRKQRFDAKKKFNKLLELHSTSTTKKDVSKLITHKLDQLIPKV